MAAAGLGGYVLCGINTTRRGDGAGPRRRRGGLPDPAHRRRAPPPARRSRPARRPRGRRRQPTSGPRCSADAGTLTPHREVGADRHLHDDLHLRAPAASPRPSQVPHLMVLFAGVALVAAVRAHRRTTSATCRCRCSTPTPCWRAGRWRSARARRWCPATFSASRLPRRRPPLRRHLHELRRQAAGLRPGDPGAARRRRQPAAGRLRQRGQRPRHRRVRPPLRLRGVGRLRLDRERRDHHPGGRLPARLDRPGLPRRRHLRLGDASRSAPSRDSTSTARWPTPTRRSASWSTPPAAGCSRGYYNDPDATDERMRHGMYWSGDLAYRDADGWIYLAGRTADWMRVDGENMAAAPIERILLRLPAISRVAVYPVPDEHVGDQVMAAVVLRDGADADARRRSASSSPPSPTCRRRRGRATSGSPTTCRPPRPTRCSSASWSRCGADPPGGRLWTRDGTRYRVYAAGRQAGE